MPTKFHYTCAICEAACVSLRPDSEARQELADDFPGFGVEDCAIVCDDCYRLMNGSADVN